MIEREVMMQLKGVHHRVKQVMQQNIDEYSLTFGQLRLMMVIKNYPDRSQKDLAEKMKFTQGAMSVVVKRLIELDMLEQVPLELDMRYNRLVITEKGQSMIDNYEEDLFKIDREMFVGLSDDEIVDLNMYLTRINENLDRINKSKNENNL